MFSKDMSKSRAKRQITLT